MEIQNFLKKYNFFFLKILRRGSVAFKEFFEGEGIFQPPSHPKHVSWWKQIWRKCKFIYVMPHVTFNMISYHFIILLHVTYYDLVSKNIQENV